MLVHTNDGFSGANANNVSNMEVGESITFIGPTWDSGTEANDELGASMPGPDFGGEGFNANRDDPIDRVRFHQGVVTSASVESGFAESSLEERHRFDNPTTGITITRTEHVRGQTPFSFNPVELERRYLEEKGVCPQANLLLP